jgi:hypothetical protein
LPGRLRTDQVVLGSAKLGTYRQQLQLVNGIEGGRLDTRQELRPGLAEATTELGQQRFVRLGELVLHFHGPESREASVIELLLREAVEEAIIAKQFRASLEQSGGARAECPIPGRRAGVLLLRGGGPGLLKTIVTGARVC